ncbi:DUF5689 domain-containing protein [uncultured Christiangramia sp.]|uniref:DUF5689 domain-containing protein n=1 Tax=uncultured Christiangramia sp. TaxID=503836 RepID=UPI00262FF10E|nr:DUF5689 domain-containing protein [uncultured Christiangramia sp.]
MNKTFFIIFLLAMTFQACVPTDDFEVPELVEDSISIEGNFTSIVAVKGNYKTETGEIHNFRDTDTWFEAYVISDDSGGNFYKKLVLQDKAQNPQSGIQILVDDNSLHQTYNFGRKVYVKLDGLSLGFNNGVLQLGIQNRGDVVAIPSSLTDDFIVRSEITSEIIPKKLSISEFSEETKNLYVEVHDIQFDINLVREAENFSFASHRYDEYDGERQLESCTTGETAFLSTSTYANFRSLMLPRGSGNIKGVLSRNYYDEHFVLIVNDPSALDFSGERCDDQFLKCDSEGDFSRNVVTEENFDGVTSNTTLAARKWTNINVSGGEKRFTPTMVNGNRLLRISAYNTLENPMEAWLVSPVIDISSTRANLVTFDLLASYDNGMFLKVYFTQDFTGDPRTTDWKLLDAAIPYGPSGGSGNVFKTSEIDISCLQGKVWIGFRYLGAAPDKTTTYDLDNFRVFRN